jgi:hypothetical protein
VDGSRHYRVIYRCHRTSFPRPAGAGDGPIAPSCRSSRRRRPIEQGVYARSFQAGKNLSSAFGGTRYPDPVCVHKKDQELTATRKHSKNGRRLFCKSSRGAQFYALCCNSVFGTCRGKNTRRHHTRPMLVVADLCGEEDDLLSRLLKKIEDCHGLNRLFSFAPPLDHLLPLAPSSYP